MNNKLLLQAIALDLKRTALGYHSGSLKMADRFLQEAIMRKKMIDIPEISESVRHLLDNIDEIAKEKNITKRAETALTYSTIFLSLAK